MRRTLLVSTLCFISLSTLGCGDCEDCQKAIDHMASKLRSQACNPSTMGNAVDGIKEDCEEYDESFNYNLVIGSLTEECHATETTTLKQTCEAPGTNVRVPIEFVSGLPSGSGAIEFEVVIGPGNSEGQRSGLLAPGESEVSSFVIANGEEIRRVDVYNEIGEVIFPSLVDLDRVKTLLIKTSPSDWSPYRRRRIVYDNTGVQYENFVR